jgi:dTDP-glucose 4,6-dehydratase
MTGTNDPAGRRVLVTGGSGFLGSQFVRTWLGRGGRALLNVDLMTYAGRPERLSDVDDLHGYGFQRGDVADRAAVESILQNFRPEVVVHFAAESHVTRGESEGERFRRTNVEGTRVMLEAAVGAGVRRFVHVSTDEVYGPRAEGFFREDEKQPGDGRATSVYARSKAVADDVARSFAGQMEVVVVRPTNCFGPWQFPEKALARWITRALTGRTVPVWGDGLHVRQWLHAPDLAEAVVLILEAASPEPVYNVGPRHDPEITNLDLARWLVGRLGLPEERVVLTTYDRPDHDRRYAVDPYRIHALGWRPGHVWESLARTVDWYRDHRDWWEPLVGEAESIYAGEEPA